MAIINNFPGGSGGISPRIVVSVTTGSTVTATKGDKTVTGTAASDSCTLIVPEAGTWSVTATLPDQTSDTKAVNVVDSYSVALTFFSATVTVNVASGATVVCRKGTTTYTKTSTGTAVFTVTETGTWTIEATSGGQTVSGTVNIVSGTTSYTITLSFVLSTLNDNDWDVIRAVSDAGEGANYWAIGDGKAVTLDGTVGKFSFLSVRTYAFIIGFDHNSSYEGTGRIHFQLAKTALSGGKDVCFIDGKYSTESAVSTTGYFSMRASNSNSGGWSSSQMRSLLGTSLSSYYGKLIGALPSALRSVLKSVTKYTDNTGNKSTSAENVTATTDYLFILAEYEVFGTIVEANGNESAKQAQYAYYSAGNSKVKYGHSLTHMTAYWWLRSPDRGSTASFALVSPSQSGNASSNYASLSLGVAPGFCV